MKEQAIPIVNFLLKRFSTGTIRIPKCTLIFIDRFDVEIDPDNEELHYEIQYRFNEKSYTVKGVICDQKEVIDLRKSFCNLFYVGFWVKKKHTKDFLAMQLTQLNLDNENLLNYKIVYSSKIVDIQYLFTITDESSTDKSLANLLKLDYTTELYAFKF